MKIHHKLQHGHTLFEMWCDIGAPRSDFLLQINRPAISLVQNATGRIPGQLKDDTNESA